MNSIDRCGVRERSDKVNGKILIVDDDRHMVKLLRTFLEGAGYDTSVATNGEEALKSIEKETPPVVLLDYIMPGMSGADVLGEIKKRHEGVDVIVVTGHGSEKVAVEMMRLGASDYLQKPFTKEELLGTVDRVTSARTEYARDVSDVSIMVVEDDKVTLSFIGKALEGLGNVVMCDDPVVALGKMTEARFDILVTDIYMPRMDGVELLKRVRIISPITGVIAVTSSAESDLLRDFIRHGASDYLKKPFEADEIRGAVTELLSFRKREFYERLKKQFEVQKMKDAERYEFILGIVEALIVALEARDLYTKGHSERVTKFSVSIAVEMELGKDEVEIVRHSARLHDLGKIGTVDDHLYKDGALDRVEMDEVERHPVLGSVILQSIKLMEEYIPGVKHHHEKFDGTGYPDGLKGDTIPLTARIISVADAYDAMRSSRPYREGMSQDIAVHELTSNRDTQFDPEVVDAMLRVLYGGDVAGKFNDKAINK